MGGLLDKANATSQEETTAEPVKTAEKKADKINPMLAKFSDVVHQKLPLHLMTDGLDYLMIGTGVLLVVGLILSFKVAWSQGCNSSNTSWIRSNHFLFRSDER